jgi:hypothetical protein
VFDVGLEGLFFVAGIAESGNPVSLENHGFGESVDGGGGTENIGIWKFELDAVIEDCFWWSGRGSGIDVVALAEEVQGFLQPFVDVFALFGIGIDVSGQLGVCAAGLPSDESFEAFHDGRYFSAIDPTHETAHR